MSDKDRTISGSKQSETIRAIKHLLDAARSGKVAAIGYALVLIDDGGDVVGGTNAIWVDDPQIRDALKNTINNLQARVAVKTGSLIMQ